MAKANEAEAVRTTIVGGRPPGSGRTNVPVPRGIEVLVKKAAVDLEFRELLLAQRGRAAASIGLELDPAESAMLRFIPQEQLARIVDQTEVGTDLRPAFMGRAAAVMLAALGTGLASGPSPARAQLQPSAPGASQTQPAGVAASPPPQLYELAADTGGPASPATPAPRPSVLGGGLGGGGALIPPPRPGSASTNSPDTNQIRARPPIVGGASGGLGAGIPPARSGNNPAGLFPGQAAPLLHGGIGFATWDTKAEFKDILVQTGDGKTLLKPDFTKGLVGWQRTGGQWGGADGVLSQNSRAVNCEIVTVENTWTNYTLSLKARRTEGTEGFLIIFAQGDDKNLYWWNIGGWGNTRSAIERMTRGAKREIPGTAVGLTIQTGTWYDIKIAVHDGTADCYFDGKLITSISQDTGHSTMPDAGPPTVFNNGNGPEPARSARPNPAVPAQPLTGALNSDLARRVLASFFASSEDAVARRLANTLSDPSIVPTDTSGGTLVQVGPARINLAERSWTVETTAGNSTQNYRGKFNLNEKGEWRATLDDFGERNGLR